MTSLDISDDELNPMEVFKRVQEYISVRDDWKLLENIYLQVIQGNLAQ